MEAPECVLERLPDNEAGQRRVGCEVTGGAGDFPAAWDFSWSVDTTDQHQEEGELDVISGQNYSVMRLPSRWRSEVEETQVRCAVRNTVGRAECQITLPPDLPLLNSSTAPLVIMVVVPAVLVIIITSLTVVFCLNRLGSSNQKYFVSSGRSN